MPKNLLYEGLVGSRVKGYIETNPSSDAELGTVML